jgi:alcohol dehydrogenase class IV
VGRLLTRHPGAAADEAVAWVRTLVEDLRIPRLGVYGISRQHTAAVVENAGKASSMKANPIALTPAELATVLELAL